MSVSRLAPITAFFVGTALCLAFWAGIVTLATGAYRSGPDGFTVAQAREALFQSARDLTEGRSAAHTAR